MDEKKIARFWSRVDKAGPVPAHCPELGNCWVWTGKRNDSGYGVLTGMHGEKWQRAHRVSWLLAHSAPGDLLVLHKCDNRACIRPDHLFLGTDLDNVTDAIAKRRNSPPPIRHGEANNKAKLTSCQVQEIRRLYSRGVSQPELVTMFDATQTTISNIVLCRVWRHLPGAVPQARKSEDRANTKLTPDSVRRMRELHRAGTAIRAIAETFGMCENATRNAVTGKTWRSVA